MTDQHVREAALDTGAHILLQAPAGSGKTTVLAQRFLAALAGVAEPEEVLAITFTRKAAAEMRERVLIALEGRLAADHPDRARWSALRTAVLAQAAARGWDLEELPTRLRIQTIDSLCHEIARAMPLLGRMHQMLRVVDDASASYQEAAEQALRDADGEARYQADADLLLQRLDNDWERAVRLLAELLPSRNRWQPILINSRPEQLAVRVADSLARIVHASLRELRAVIPAPLLERGTELVRSSVRNLQPEAAQGHPGELPQWQAMARLALKEDGDWRKTVNVNHGFPKEDRPLKQAWQQWRDALQELPRARELLQAVTQLPSPLIDAAEAAALAALARLMLLAAATLKLVFRERGHVDHGEIAAVARHALREMDTPTELSVRQTLRVRHLLVDEFQDTSPDQLDLVKELIGGWDDDVPRSLFLVGDPMQSIYLFRNSEVGLFLQTRAGGVGAIPLDTLRLTRNFRAVPELVDWSNAAFSRIFPATEDIRSSAVTFLHSEAARAAPAVPEPAVTIWPQPEPRPQAEAEAIAAEIASLRQSEPMLRIAVLVQTRALAAPILAALRRQGVAALGVELAPLADRAVVRELIAIGAALLHAGDRTAWLTVLRAPFCGLTLGDLHALGGGDSAVPLTARLADEPAWAALSSDGRQRLRRVAPLLLAGWRMRGSTDLATSIEVLWRRLGGWFACRETADRRAALQFLAALRRATEEGVALDGAGLQQLAGQLRDQGEAGTHPVEILTIHHAKGLEWDVVFIPGLGRRPRGDMPPLLRWLELPAPAAAGDLLLAVRSVGDAGTADPLGRYIARLQAERQDNERVRLAYVAVTRARRRLYLSGHAPWSAQQSAPVPPPRSLLQILWPAVREAFMAVASAPQPEGEAAPRRRAIDAPWYRLPADFHPPASASALPVTGFMAQVSDAGEQPEFSWVGPLARAAGTVLHAELERFATQGMPDASTLEARRDGYATRLREHGVARHEAERVAAAIAQQLRQVVAEPRARWLFDTTHREARSEWRLSGVVDGALRDIVIDRSFVDQDGQRWIIDYKTSTHGGGGLEEFLQRELARYRPQLDLYRQLAVRIGPEPVRTALYFPLLGVFREL